MYFIHLCHENKNVKVIFWEPGQGSWPFLEARAGPGLAKPAGVLACTGMSDFLKNASADREKIYDVGRPVWQ